MAAVGWHSAQHEKTLGIQHCAEPNRTTSSNFDHTEKKTHAAWSSGQNGRVDRRQENSDCSSPE